MSQSNRTVARGNKSREQINEERKPNRLRLSEARSLLTVKNLDPNRYYRWVNDAKDGQTIEMMKLRGYRIETSKTLKVGDPDQSKAVGDGSPHKQFAGMGADGKAMYAYLMSVSREWHDEDQADIAKEVDEQEIAILNPNLEDMDEDERPADYVARDAAGKPIHGMVAGKANAKLRNRR